MRAEMGRRNRAEAEGSSDWDRVTERHLTIYDGVPRRAPAARCSPNSPRASGDRPSAARRARSTRPGATPGPRAELRATQDAALRRLALHAYEQVRYYRRLFDRHRLHPRHLRGVVDLDLMPATDARRPAGPGPGAPAGARRRSRRVLTVPARPRGRGPALYRTWLEDLLHLLHRVRALGGLGVHPRDRVAIVRAAPTGPTWSATASRCTSSGSVGAACSAVRRSRPGWRRTWRRSCPTWWPARRRSSTDSPPRRPTSTRDWWWSKGGRRCRASVPAWRRRSGAPVRAVYGLGRRHSARRRVPRDRRLPRQRRLGAARGAGGRTARRGRASGASWR